MKNPSDPLTRELVFPDVPSPIEPFAPILVNWDKSFEPSETKVREQLIGHLHSSHRLLALRWMCAASKMGLWRESLGPLPDEDPLLMARRADQELEQALYTCANFSQNTTFFDDHDWRSWALAYPSSGFYWIEGHHNPDHITRLERLLIHASFGCSSLLDQLKNIWSRIEPHAAWIRSEHYSRWMWWLCRGHPTETVQSFLHVFHQRGGDPSWTIPCDHYTDQRRVIPSCSILEIAFYRWQEKPWPMGYDIRSECFTDASWQAPPPVPCKKGMPIGYVAVTKYPDHAEINAPPDLTKEPTTNRERAPLEKLVSTLLAMGARTFDLRKKEKEEEEIGWSVGVSLIAQVASTDVGHPRWSLSDFWHWWSSWKKAGWTLTAPEGQALLQVLKTLCPSRYAPEVLSVLLFPHLLGTKAWWPSEDAHEVIETLLRLPTRDWTCWFEPDPFLNRQIRQITHRLEWPSPLGAEVAWVPCAMEAALDDYLAVQPLSVLKGAWVRAWTAALEPVSWNAAHRAKQWAVAPVTSDPSHLLCADPVLTSGLQAAWKNWQEAHPLVHQLSGLTWELYSSKSLAIIKDKFEKKDHPVNNKWIKCLEEKGLAGGRRALVLADAALRAIPALRVGFPHFDPILRRLEEHWALETVGNRAFSLPPLLLAGPPGTGKTFFFSELAKAVNTAYHILNMESINAGFAITGMEQGWADSTVGLVFEKLALAAEANPIFLFDEIDKCTHVENAPVEPVLLSLLEPHSARQFTDRCLPLPLDIRPVAWVATANDLSKVSEPIKSRFEIIEVPQPDVDARRALARTIYTALRTGHSWGAFFDRDPTSTFIDALAAPPGSARNLRKFLTQAFAAAALAKRPTLTIHDLPLGSIAPRALWDQPLPERRGGLSPLSDGALV